MTATYLSCLQRVAGRLGEGDVEGEGTGRLLVEAERAGQLQGDGGASDVGLSHLTHCLQELLHRLTPDTVQ